MVHVCPPKNGSENKQKLLCTLKKMVQSLEGDLSVPEKVNDMNTPNDMICFRVSSKKGAGDETKNGEKEVIRVKQSKSRELRASILYTGCDCEKRYGLQDDCPRTGCHGSPECLTKPPTCGPSEFCNGKHLGKKFSPGTESTGHHKCFMAFLHSPVCCTPYIGGEVCQVLQ